MVVESWTAMTSRNTPLTSNNTTNTSHTPELEGEHHLATFSQPRDLKQEIFLMLISSDSDMALSSAATLVRSNVYNVHVCLGSVLCLSAAVPLSSELQLYQQCQCCIMSKIINLVICVINRCPRLLRLYQHFTAER